MFGRVFWRLPGTLAALSSSVLVGGALLVGSQERSGGDALMFLGLSLPLTGFGFLYDQLVRRRRLLPGGRNLVLYWVVFFPLARLIHVFMVQGRFWLLSSGNAVPPSVGFGEAGGVLGFLLWQAVFGFAYGFGFLLLYYRVCDLLMRGVSR